MEGDKLIAKVRVKTIRFFNGETDWGVITFSIVEYLTGNEAENVKDGSVALGVMVEPIIGGEYYLEAVASLDKKWGWQYEIACLCSSLFLDENDKHGQRIYLETLYSAKQIIEMYKALDDPYKALKDKDVESLVKVKGCGFKTAGEWIERFEKNYNASRVCAELAPYGFTSNMIKRLLGHFKSPDVVINTVKNKPYDLIDVQGFGWKTCDEIAQKGGLDKHCPERVTAFLKHCLHQQAEEGYTYVYANEQLLPAILEMMGDDIPDEPILEALQQLDGLLWWSDDKSALGLKYYVNLECDIARKLIELRDAPNNFEYSNWEQVIKKKEEEQGWEYTEQQIEGIKATLENQVVIITGLGGTGKSSIVAGVIEVLKRYKFAQCALAGRAAARLSEVTHEKGSTIHRLLGFPSKDEKHQKFFFNQDNYLPYQIVIVDEISMISGQLFWCLIRALRPGTKLILLGDVGQLESIGCSNIANDLIESPEIKSVVLDKIHRQAAASAIITESIKARNGEQIIDKGFAGMVTKGELKDLTYDCYSDANNTYYRVLEWASKLKDEGLSVLDIQVIVPRKEGQAGTWNLNLALQEIFNPLDGRDQLIASYGKNGYMPFRVGDKVINTQNNYKCVEYTGQWEKYYPPRFEDEEDEGIKGPSACPVFNGNMGTVLAINMDKQEMVVDFIGIGKILITSGMLNKIMLGYAVTVHKCQGSEFPYIIFGIDFSSYSLLTRQLVYTAITRASKHCYVLAQSNALRYAICQNSVSKKQTILKDALYDLTHPVF